MAEPTTGFTPAPLITTVAPTPFSLGPALQPDFDPIERLPEERKDLLRKIRQHADDGCALAVPFETVREASMDKVEAENELKRRTGHPQDGGFGLKPEDRSVISATKDVEKATANLRRVQELQEVRAAAQQAALQVKTACEDWLRHGVPGNCKLEAVELEQPKLVKGETVLDGIDRLRRRRRELKAAIHTIQSSCFPKSYCKNRAREMVEALARAPDVSMLVEFDREIVWPTMRVQSEVIGAGQRGLAFHEAIDVVGLMASLLKPALISFLDTLVDAESDDPAALSHVARQQREAEAMGDLLAVERDESALVWMAQAQGLAIEHRSACAPEAILGCRLITAPRANETPETTMGLSWPMRR
jgi:hypothetical protein